MVGAGAEGAVEAQRKPRRATKTSPTARSLTYLRGQGALVAVVEHWNAFARRRVDLFGFIDLVVLDTGPGVLGVQTTTTENMSHRMTKLRTECGVAMLRWLEAGNRLVVHGWAKRGARGARKLWTVREQWVNTTDLIREDA